MLLEFRSFKRRRRRLQKSSEMHWWIKVQRDDRTTRQDKRRTRYDRYTNRGACDNSQSGDGVARLASRTSCQTIPEKAVYSFSLISSWFDSKTWSICRTLKGMHLSTLQTTLACSLYIPTLGVMSGWLGRWERCWVACVFLLSWLL